MERLKPAAGLLALGLTLLLGPAPPTRAQASFFCVTPTRICKTAYAGPRGAPCACKTYAGSVRGRLA